MFTVKGEHYYNDYTREDFVKSFPTLDSIFDWMKEVSENFTGEYGSYFPRISSNTDTDSMGKISAKDAHNRGYLYWIYQIETEKGIVYSAGIYTGNKRFCAEKLVSWFAECNNKIKICRSEPKFVEL